MPEFGNKRLTEIDTQAVTEFKTRLRRKVKPNGELLSKTRINMVLTRLKQILSYGAEQG